MTFELTARLIQAASCGIGELKRAGRQEEADALTATVTEVTVVLETPPEDDAALVEKARGGDYGAFEGLVKHHQGKTYALALGIVKNAAEAEEVVQDTFFSAFQHLDTFRGDARFTTWIYRVATNHALMKLRKKRPCRTRIACPRWPCSCRVFVCVHGRDVAIRRPLAVGPAPRRGSTGPRGDRGARGLPRPPRR